MVCGWKHETDSLDWGQSSPQVLNKLFMICNLVNQLLWPGPLVKRKRRTLSQTWKRWSPWVFWGLFGPCTKWWKRSCFTVLQRASPSMSLFWWFILHLKSLSNYRIQWTLDPLIWFVVLLFLHDIKEEALLVFSSGNWRAFSDEGTTFSFLRFEWKPWAI